ncbi:hypothetical protein T484DRAFT_1776741 [Baffinella frigidus]|nr:hypothetical protein T484DRAFT_1776741 [Cryptophyta sp. CCMP2293]
MVAVPLSLAISISLMALSGCIHPPGAACGLIFITASQEFRAVGWAYLIPVTILGPKWPKRAACGLIFITASQEFRAVGWAYLIPVSLGCIVCLFFALVVNNLHPARSYPVVW